MVIFLETARAITPELIEELDDHGPDLVEDPPSQPDQEAQGRQKSVAALKPFDPYAVFDPYAAPAMKALLQTSLPGYWFCWSGITCIGAAFISKLVHVIINFNM